MVQQAEHPEALPADAVIVKVGKSYRLVWNLGDNLGYAWYSIDAKHLKNLYDTETPEVDERFEYDRVGQFESRFGNNYWGNAQEITLKAETPWDDLRTKIYNQFGFVPGLDQPEIKRLLTQAFFEGWTENQWVVEYRRTKYYNSLNDTQRQWSSLSQSEKDQRTQAAAVDLANKYKDLWGTDISPSNSSIRAAALKVASGVLLLERWEFDTRQQAQRQEGTPAWNAERARQRDARAEGNLEEDLALEAENQWREWVGPINMPTNFGAKWGADLATGKKSQADLENYLRKISGARWQHKPPDVTWSDWSAPYKSQVRDELELNSIDDKDPMLSRLLNMDLTGQDVTQAIRQDKRFLSTQKMYGELSSAAADMGRRFGFIT